MFIVTVRYLRERQSYDADGSLRSSGGVQKVLRQNNTDGRVAEAFAPQMRDMPGEDTTS